MKIVVDKITNQEQQKEAFAVRYEVFVMEQNVPSKDEYDQYEDSSNHFIATLGGEIVGTARWRFTPNGIKLERFAVSKTSRGKGVGRALVKAVLDDIKNTEGTEGKLKYLHAQLDAIPLYGKFGFIKVGEMFEECNILHFQMELSKN